MPTHFAAVRLACNCFDAKMPELEKTLQIIRSKEKEPDKYFPKKLNRVMLGKAEIEDSEHLTTVAYRAVYGAIRYSDEKPIFGDAAELAERLALDFPRLYSDILGKLNLGSVQESVAVDVLIREVFLPTFFLTLAKARRNPHGNEMTVENCWYLPKEIRGKSEYPFQRVLLAWLNAAGCRGPEDVGKLLQTDSKRKNVSNWLKGKNVPSRSEISRLVKVFKEETDRFEDLQAWKGRLMLAAAMQRLFESMDKYFSKSQPRYSFKLLGMLQQIEKEQIPIDCENIFLVQKTFFAARLIYNRVKTTEAWRKELAALPKQMSFHCKRSVSRSELDEIQRQQRFKMNPGNLLMKFIKKELPKRQPKGLNPLLENDWLIKEIFALGVAEINRIIKERGRQKSSVGLV